MPLSYLKRVYDRQHIKFHQMMLLLFYDVLIYLVLCCHFSYFVGAESPWGWKVSILCILLSFSCFVGSEQAQGLQSLRTLLCYFMFPRSFWCGLVEVVGAEKVQGLHNLSTLHSVVCCASQ